VRCVVGVGGEQRLDLEAHRVVARAFGLKERVSFGRRQRERRVKQRLEPLQPLARSDAHAASSRSSQAFAKRRSRSTVAADVPVAWAISS